MSSMAPRGPLPARVYWVRRGIVLGVALLLVLVVGRLLTGGSDGTDQASGPRDSAQLVGSQTSQTTDPTASSSATTATTETTAGTKGLPLAEPTGPCDPDKVTVTPVGGKRANDGHVAMILAVGTSEEACTFTFSPESVVVKIESGSDSIWSSQQCSVLPTQDLVVRAAKPAAATFTWNGHRSDATCSRSTAWALPGTYHAIAATLGGEPTDTAFELTRPPTVVVTKTAKPKVTATATSTATSSTSTKAGRQP
ncbi:hypothetical protein [Nocardioides jiangxiensis]|uniref:DUF4232 domain-containing protein n=1 Tax=Nocardioides jiangxiensis TaxID=3064524 RepID=A0ABT9B134_9ACTN|nr:hypothetical protein [Nocardioides sp. WY-20]MDO7868564.1 hypothetical protein [Nocardioides sp. WY-20]